VCTSKFEKLHAPCLRPASKFAPPYGNDPVFNPTKTLYRPDLMNFVAKYYNVTPGSEGAVEKNPSRPGSLVYHPFYQREGVAGLEGVYPLLLESGIPGSRAVQVGGGLGLYTDTVFDRDFHGNIFHWDSYEFTCI
jgi:hypothetical protein